MACYAPLKAWKPAGGGKLRFTVGESPPPDGVFTRIMLPCNQCIGCRVDRSRAWAARCVHESQLHSANSFITLTYADDHLPEDHSVSVREWQLFAKRLRKRTGPFRFFACGEYGDQSLRPHYHALLFGHDFRESRELIRQKPHPLWRSEVLDSAWGKGHASIGALTYETASYVARYCMKKVNGDQAEEHYERVDAQTGEVFRVQPEFVSMSRGGRTGARGIGHEWFQKYRSDVYPHDDVVIDGKRHRPPRYYDQQLEEEELRRLKVERRKRAVRRSADLTDARLKTRRRIAERKLANRQRSI